MIDKNLNSYEINWVLNNELAISRAPINESELRLIKEQNIQSILSLCDKKEAPIPKNISKYFNTYTKVLPDHKAGRIISLIELEESIDILREAKKSGSVLVHCLYAVERSPLLCMAWLVKELNLKPQEALQYMMQIHKGTNPLPEQLKILDKL